MRGLPPAALRLREAEAVKARNSRRLKEELIMVILRKIEGIILRKFHD
jgi:hypothetical protein